MVLKIKIGDEGVKLASQAGLEKQLQARNIRCLIDTEGDQVTEFAVLIDGSTYTCGPVIEEQKGPSHHHRTPSKILRALVGKTVSTKPVPLPEEEVDTRNTHQLVVEPKWREKRYPIITGSGKQRQEFGLSSEEEFRGAYIVGKRRGIRLVKDYGNAGTVVKDVLVPHLQFSYLPPGQVTDHKENHQSFMSGASGGVEVTAGGHGGKLSAQGSAASAKDFVTDVAQYRSAGIIVVSWDMKHNACKLDANLVILVEDKAPESAGFVARAGNLFGFF